MNGTDSMMNGNPKMTGRQITLKSMEHHTITTKIRKEKNMLKNMEKFESLSIKEKREEALLALSDGVRMIAEEYATLKRSFVLEYGTEEEFDKAFNRELDRAYRKVRNMSKKDMALHMIMKMMANQALDFDIDGEDEDA